MESNCVWIIEISSGKFQVYIIQYKMAAYKEKIQKALKKAMDKFQKQQSHPFKSHIIQKKHKASKNTLKGKRLFKPQYNQYQRHYVQTHQDENSLFNFYNILTINESAFHDSHEPIPYIKSLFFTKTTRKIEIHDNYLILQLSDNCVLPSSISQTLTKYRDSGNQKLQHLANMLQNLQRKLGFACLDSASEVSITQDAYKLFDSLGQTIFLSKIADQKLIISKSFLQLCQYDMDQFIMQSLIHKTSVLQGPLCHNYQQILTKQIENYSRMIDFLQGSIPLSSFVQISKMSYVDYITSRADSIHKCAMSLTMPIPLVQLITIDQVLDTQPFQAEEKGTKCRLELKNTRNRFENKSYEMLQYLVELPENRLPSNSNKVAEYIQLDKCINPSKPKSQDSQMKIYEKITLDSQIQKSPITSYLF